MEAVWQRVETSVREVKVGADIEGYTVVKSGLESGEKVFTKGSFTLKTQLQKGELD